MLHPVRLLIISTLVLALTACGGTKLDGIWVGSGTRLDNNGPFTGSITIVESETGFTGSLSVSGSLQGTLQVGGTTNGNSLTFVQGISGTASLSGSTMTITANAPIQGGGAAPFTFTATKQ